MLDASATEDEVAAGGPSLTLHRCSASPARDQCGRPLPANLPRERVVVPAPPLCPGCGGNLVKFGEDITKTLEVVPRQWKVIQTVRE
jgi:transposase